MMRILVVGVHFFSSFAWSIKRAFERMGHNVDEFDYRENPFAKFPRLRSLYSRTVMQKKLIRAVRESDPHLVVIGKGELINGSTVETIRREFKATIVNWFPDPRLFSYREVVRSLPFLTCLFTKNPENIVQAELLGFRNVHFLPHCADVELHLFEKETNNGFGTDVAFVGSGYLYRDLILCQLTEFELKIWGGSWSGSITGQKKPAAIAGQEARGLDQARVFRESSINLNTHQFDDIRGINQRTFDICGSGGFQLVDYKTEIEKFFKIGTEIETYESIDELKEKIRYYLRNREKGREIGRRAQETVRAAHTYDHRVREILRRANV